MRAIIILFFALQYAPSQELFSVGAYKDSLGTSMRYLLHVPKDSATRSPLVIWLHGAGSRGDDPQLVLGYGANVGAMFFVREDNQFKYPCYVLAPQCPQFEYWADFESDKPARRERMVLELVRTLTAQYPIDTLRMYVVGISMGGYGVWDILGRYPGFFAAAVPMCSGGDWSKAPLMKNMPIWAFHGAADDIVPVDESRSMIQAIRNAGGNPKYTEYPGVDHRVWIPAFAEKDFIKWMFKQKRKK